MNVMPSRGSTSTTTTVLRPKALEGIRTKGEKTVSERVESDTSVEGRGRSEE